MDRRPALVERVDQWLAEGIDIDEDGLYSERSANYAAHVSNPSLLTIAEVLDRPALVDAVERNLDATLDLLLPDGSVVRGASWRAHRGAVRGSGARCRSDRQPVVGGSEGRLLRPRALHPGRPD